MHVLRLNGSPRGDRSESAGIAGAYLESLRAAEPGLSVDRLDLFALTPFAAQGASAKMDVIAGEAVAGERRAAWDDALATTARLRAADLVLAAVPMWNGGIPWALKLFIDTVTQPGLAFAFDPETGYSGLLGGRRAVVVYTSQVYAPGVAPAFGTDFQSTYFENWLRFVGIDRIETLRLQPTYAGDPGLPARRDRVHRQARELARA
jgi:FMN-dependent NADH-azoreductase